jgi:FkbM family methyltransferase
MSEEKKFLFFDIGANIGRWSIENHNIHNKIVCVEASERTYKILCNNVKNYKDIITLNYAVCDSKDKFIKFYDCHCNTLSTINKEWLTNEKSRFFNQTFSETISPVISMDELIKNYGIPDLIKIDVEGGEFNCVKSLTSKVPMICFEWASELNEVTFNCIDYLKSIGFENFHIQFQDSYKYRPEKFELNLIEIKHLLNLTKPKIDWGMIWCK